MDPPRAIDYLTKPVVPGMGNLPSNCWSEYSERPQEQ